MNAVGVLIFAMGCFQLVAGNYCPPHSHYERCGTACPLTCSNYENPPTVCPLICVSGCFCDEGYVFDEILQCCVLPSNCSYHCGPCEQFSNCTSPCQPYCDNPTPNCTKNCIKGCECIKGYIRDIENGTCIPKEDCNNTNCKCPGDHEIYVNCTGCEPTCENLNSTGNCSIPCTPGCICSPGYVRDENDDCIPEDECPIITAPPCNSTSTVPPETTTTYDRAHSNDRHHGGNQNRHLSNEYHARHHSERHLSGRHQNLRQHKAKHHEGKHHEAKGHEAKHHEGKYHAVGQS